MIVLAAIKTNDNTIYTGKCHAYAMIKILSNEYISDDKQGFITDTGEFLDRFKAGEHAIKCGQIIEMKYSYGLDSSEVCAKTINSEDVIEYAKNRKIYEEWDFLHNK